MIRDRLKKLERLVAESKAHCPGCRLMPCHILLPGDPDPTETQRCPRCGKEHLPSGIRIVVPGLSTPLVGLD